MPNQDEFLQHQMDQAAPDTRVVVGMTVDEVMEMRNNVLVYLERAKQLKAEFEASLLAYIEEKGSFEWGGIRFYAGTRKTTKCVNKMLTMQLLLEGMGGDLNLVVSDLLASQPFRYGACRDVLGDEFDKCFSTEEKPDLKTGTTKREVMTLPTNVKRKLPK